MQGFASAMDPSFGLFRCCDGREGKLISDRYGRRSFGDQSNRNPGNSSLFGVGIGFLPDKSEALVVSTLIPQGA
jgi:hypothetical protein